jgi:hypothetical protein
MLVMVQVQTTSGSPAQHLASASLLGCWQDAPLRKLDGIGSAISSSTDDTTLLTCSATQQALSQPGMYVSSAPLSPEFDLGRLTLSNPALQLLGTPINSVQQQQLQEQEQAQREQDLLQQYEQQQRQQQQLLPQAQEQQNSSQWGASATVFFAGVSPIATTEALLGVFAQFGRVMNINLFKPYQGAKTSKVGGFVLHPLVLPYEYHTLLVLLPLCYGRNTFGRIWNKYPCQYAGNRRVCGQPLH